MIDIFSQGFLARKLLHHYSDTTVAILGLILSFIGYLMVASLTFFPSVMLLYASVIVFITGDGLFEPASSSLIANAADRTMQGRVQGANQGMQAIARVLGPLYAAFVYTYGRSLPYIINAVLIIIALTIFARSLTSIKNSTSAA